MSADQWSTYAATRAALTAMLLDRVPALRSRTPDDFALAAVDAWACLADILGFDAARVHDEASLDRATDLRSVTELARLLGYQPDPGVAASTALVFTLDDAVGGPEEVLVPSGTPVQRTPPPGQPAHTYETVEDLTGRPAWNQMSPRLGGRQVPDGDTVLLAGVATGVRPGDGVVVPTVTAGGTTTARFALVSSVVVRPDDPPVPGSVARRGWTALTLGSLPGRHAWPVPFDGADWFTDPPLAPPLAGLVAEGLTVLDHASLQDRGAKDGFVEADLVAALRAARPAPGAVLVFRQQASILGSGAPEWLSLPKSLRDDLVNAASERVSATPLLRAQTATPSSSATRSEGNAFAQLTTLSMTDLVTHFGAFRYVSWADSTLDDYPGVGPAAAQRVFADSSLGAVGPGPCVLRDGDAWSLRRASSVTSASKSVFTVSGRATVLTLAPATGDNPGLGAFDIRRTTVFGGGEWMPLAPGSGVEAVGGPDQPGLALSDWYVGLAPGRRVYVTGRSAVTPGVVRRHVTVLRAVSHDLSRDGGTTIRLADPLPEALEPTSVRVSANVALATHGEQRTEVLAHGNGRDPLPRFTLAAGPLTYTTGPGGSVSSLRVFVDGLRREEVPALLVPGEQGYVVGQDADGRTVVQFGSPLPTGLLNVRATYRVGLGTGATVGPEELTLLTRRPPGVRSVTNPLAATGGADPESLAGARRNAPVSVRTLGRVVSLADYADYALGFPGVSKARATRAGVGGRPGVALTVVGESGALIGRGDAVHDALHADLTSRGDPLVPVSLVPHRPVTFRIAAGLRVDPRQVAADVLAHAAAVVDQLHSFERRDLAQPVTASEVNAVLHRVPGVLAADLRQCCRLVDGAPADGVLLRDVIPAQATGTGAGGEPLGAELLLLEPSGARLTVVTT